VWVLWRPGSKLYLLFLSGNALPETHLGTFDALDDPCQALMRTAMRQRQLTAQAYRRVLKLSRTIADLAKSETITQVHLA
jgi:magnesium chelatase family protein